ncbi:hypothetical protein [Labrys miyagiensis]|uniref:hypothetical protein n=1 Tax=Labrys miyagiensis TaxID=346912 RepID=UPI0024E0E2BC|nr:hypothetical protein [Labrys miyagiensis]
MKKIVLAAAALSFAALAYAPASASATPARDTASVGATMYHHHHHCKIVKTNVRHHGHWVWTSRKVCR